LIKVENITKSFGDLQVLKGINLEVPAGKLYSIVGPSGAGKTTLLQIIGTLSKPNAGNIFINGQNISKMGETQLADFRNKQIGFVFQFHYLLPEFSAFENVCIPAYIAKSSKKEAEQKAREYLEFLGLSHRLNHKPAELSGGERQRVAIARALINNPSVILADEPSGNLDTKNREDLHQLFFTLRDKFKQTLVIVTHDESFASQSDAIIRMRDGLIEN
jgi:ABC-type antimicrobial peptide transport system, ATPase component